MTGLAWFLVGGTVGICIGLAIPLFIRWPR